MFARKFILYYGVFVNIININAFRSFDVNGVETILAMENEMISIQCKTDGPMAYCGFIHPNGKRYSFSGSTLNAGQCAIKIKASITDSGEWRCHIGGKGAIGVEIIQHIRLRVVEEVAAMQKNISAVHGKSVTIACMTTKGLTPLRYCRFEPPNDGPFSINSDVNITSPILGRYYFPQNKSLDRGDCAVIIHKVKYEDVGTWTCGVGMDDGKGYIDTVSLEVEGLYTMSTASATGITFGAIAVFLAVLGFIVWKKRRFLGSVPADAGEQEMEQLRHQDVEMSLHGTPRPSPHASPKVIHVPLRTSQGSLATSHVLPKEAQMSLRATPQHSPKSSHISLRASHDALGASTNASPIVTHVSLRSSQVSLRASSYDHIESPPHDTQRDSSICPKSPRKTRKVSEKSASHIDLLKKSQLSSPYMGVNIPEIILKSPTPTKSISSD